MRNFENIFDKQIIKKKFRLTFLIRQITNEKK